MPTLTAKTAKRTNLSGLIKGDKLSMTYYLTVNKTSANEIEVTDQSGNNFTIRGKSLIENTMYSANQFAGVEKITRTEMVDKLEQAGDSVFTVNFDKQDSTNRTLVGHLLATEPKMGRSQVRDLEIITGNNSRLVDHRTLNWIIVKGTKYTVK